MPAMMYCSLPGGGGRWLSWWWLLIRGGHHDDSGNWIISAESFLRYHSLTFINKNYKWIKISTPRIRAWLGLGQGGHHIGHRSIRCEMLRSLTCYRSPVSDQLTPWDAEMWKVTPHGWCLLRAGHISIPSLSSSGHMSQVTQEPSDHS